MRQTSYKDIKKIIINQTKFTHVVLQVNGFHKDIPLKKPNLSKYVVLRNLNPGKKSFKLPILKSPLTWMGMFHMVQCYYDYFFSFDLDIYFLKRFHAVKDDKLFRIDYGLNYFNFFSFFKFYSVHNYIYYYIYYDFLLREIYLLESKFGIFLQKSKYIIPKEFDNYARNLNYIYNSFNQNSAYSIKLKSFIAGYFDILGTFNFIFRKDLKLKFGISINIEFCAYVPKHAVPLMSLSPLFFYKNVEEDTFGIADKLIPGDFDELDVDESFRKDYRKYMEITKFNLIDEKKIFKLKDYFNRYIKWNNKEWDLFLLNYTKPREILDHFNYVHEVWWLPEGSFDTDIYKANINSLNFLKIDSKKFYSNKLNPLDIKIKLNNNINNKLFNLKRINKNKEDLFVYKISDKYVLLYDLIPFFKKYLMSFSSKFIYLGYLEFILKEYSKNNNFNISKYIKIIEIIFCEIGYKGINFSFFELIDIIIENSTET